MLRKSAKMLARKSRNPFEPPGREMRDIAAIPTAVLDLILRAARQAAPREACGLLFGSGSAIESAVPTPNRALHSSEFLVDPLLLAQAESSARRRGQRLLGFFHSHTGEPPDPSIPDRIGVLWGADWPHLQLIVSLSGAWRLYQVEHGQWACVLKS